jgi:predicted nucleic acid-binding protein
MSLFATGSQNVLVKFGGAASLRDRAGRSSRPPRTLRPLERLPGQQQVGVLSSALLRLLSNETVMGASRRTPRQAWRDYDRLLAQRPVGYLHELAHVDRILRSHTLDEEASASLWTDAYLAAFARAADVRLATFDRGFSRFSGLRLHLLE